jgi:DNA transformation protein
MAVPQDQVDYVLEQMQQVGALTTRKMFGGVGFSADGLFFAFLHSDGNLYLKVDQATRPAFEARGSTPFTAKTPSANGRVMSMPYLSVPEDILEDPDELAIWARKAIAVAARAKK